MKKFTYAILLSLSYFTASSQIDSTVFARRPKVGIFIPLFLDDVFDADGKYKYPTTIPKNVLSGLEFYSGVRLALDSLQDAGVGVEVFIIDTKDRTRTVQQAIDEELSDASLFIGMVQGAESNAEIRTLSDAALKRHIPFISATYPNDGGISNNPSLVIINSTLKAHNQATYKYIQNNYYDNNIVIFKKQGSQEEKIKATLEEANARTGGMKINWKMVDISEDATVSDIEQYLDSTRNNVCVCASLNMSFGTNLLQQLSSLSNNYNCTVFGMPNWDALRLDKPDYKGLEVFVTTPFVTASGANPQLVRKVASKFTARSRSRASDIVYRGYEVTLRFISDMVKHADYVIDLSSYQDKVFNEFDIQTVRLNNSNSNTQPDYYENKKVYFIKKVNGVIKGVY